MKVLVAEDEPHIRDGLVEVLEREGYQPIACADGSEALRAFERERPGFVCLDIMLPGIDGFELCRKIRARDAGVPVIFITAKSEEIDKVVGLELGADDFIVKPFGVRELVARIRAITRRCLATRSEEQQLPFRLGDLEVAPAELRAHRGTRAIDLSLRDVQILRLFYVHRGEVLTRQRLFNAIWGIDYLPSSRALDQHISQLRKRIEVDPREPAIILTVHGAGYRYDG